MPPFSYTCIHKSVTVRVVYSPVVRTSRGLISLAICPSYPIHTSLTLLLLARVSASRSFTPPPPSVCSKAQAFKPHLPQIIIQDYHLTIAHVGKHPTAQAIGKKRLKLDCGK